jgi:hypothetical protein
MTLGPGEDGEPLRMRLSPTLARWPHDVRRWIRGAKPLLSRTHYENDDAAVSGYRFFASTQPLGEARQAADEADKFRRAWRSVEDLFAPSPETEAEE